MFNGNVNGNFMGGAPMMGYPMGTGYQFNPGQQVQQPKMMNTLTDEEIQKLVKKENQFSLQITETEKMRGICNHRNANGIGDAIIEDPATGECTCQICQYKFMPIDPSTSVESIKDSVANVVDIIQTIKLIYIDMPQEAAREYYQLIPLLEKLPTLFDYACKDYAKHENVNMYGYNGNRNMGALQLFQMLAGNMANGYQQPQGQPMMNPQMQPQQGMPNPAFQSNGFGYVGNGYQPQMKGFQYSPDMTQQGTVMQNPGQVAPQTTQTATDGNNTTVTDTFKA